MEDLPDRRGRDPGQALGGRSERLAKGRERPGRRAIGLRGGGTPRFAEDPLACLMIIESRLPAAVARRRRGRALGVEAGDQVGDGVAGASAGRAGSGLVVVTPGDGQERGDPGDVDGGSGLGPAAPGQFVAFAVGDRPEGVLLATRHGGLGVTRGRPS